MSFIYPRTISINRPAMPVSAGDAGYLGLSRSTETTVLTGLPASIQFDRDGSAPSSDTPSDVIGRGLYRAFIPAASAALGSILERDVVVDDLGNRYQVTAAAWDSLGFQLRVERLTA